MLTDRPQNFFTRFFGAQVGERKPALTRTKNASDPEASEACDLSLGAPRSDGFDGSIVNLLAEKILLSWLRNRYQLLFPFTFDLKRLDQEQTKIVVSAMLAAAEADGTFERKERTRIEQALKSLGITNDIQGRLNEILVEPPPLNTVLAQITDIHAAALVYAASLIAVDQRKPVNRLYLRYLAARLQLPEELVGSLDQRFRSSG